MFYVLRKNRQRWEKIMPGIPSFSPGWQSVPGCLITWPLWHQGQGQLSAQSGPGPGSLTATHNGKTDSQWTPSSHWKLKVIQITWRVPTYVLMKSPLVLTKYLHYRYSPVLDRFCLLANWLTACTPHPYQRSSGLTPSLLAELEWGVLVPFSPGCMHPWMMPRYSMNHALYWMWWEFLKVTSSSIVYLYHGQALGVQPGGRSRLLGLTRAT